VLHSLNDVVGFGRVGVRCWIGNWCGTGAAATEEVVAAGTVEVAVNEPKRISTGLARIAAMLTGKTIPDRATMLHNEFPIAPTWRANCQGMRPG
jgi:hypothetical protein